MSAGWRKELIEKIRRRLTLIGVALCAIGLLAVIFPIFFSVLTKVAIGWIVFMIGAITLYHAFWARSVETALLCAVVALIYIALGVYLSLFMATGLVGLTTMISMVFLFEGLMRVSFSLRHRPRVGWEWLMTSAAISVALGVTLLILLPEAAEWALGMTMGLNAIATGVAVLAISRSVDP